ncbi:electron transport complex protein RnfG [Rhodoblastus acidophilus]|uniref:Ion-translocating oxidoreductase complex subunit G n=1 Tax=Rhodoblastus acidophilus TaxID=1074 RepID=A0A212PVM2_RHOAC|nr:FMN-binding protein [Rhodoblastus acidophilus]SNB51013.1 electron transport complex protein RnfG [Rhodoblastus acidophilus]
MSASDNTPQVDAAAHATPTFTLLRALSVVSAICGLIIVGSYLLTLDRAKDNRRLASERAVIKVLPDAKSVKPWLALANGDVVPAGEGDPPTGAVRFYAAYDANGHLDGVAAEGAAKGYADTVRVMFGYRKACQCIVGFGVVSMRETPGIGDKIITDKDFLANFKALDVKLTEDLAGLANEVKVVKHGTKAQGWQIDAISGSTVTSRAVGKGINDAAQILLPRLVPKIDRLEKQ